MKITVNVVFFVAACGVLAYVLYMRFLAPKPDVQVQCFSPLGPAVENVSARWDGATVMLTFRNGVPASAKCTVVVGR